MKLFAILIVLVLQIFCFAGSVTVPAAKATYVEGPILRDTYWTLVDSPFVVSGGILVYPNATLTVEPGVEIRFGDEFSLMVEGRLLADGVEGKPIRFTSNKEEPLAGDWDTISFIGINESSLTRCTIEYGTNGLTIENGIVVVRYSQIGFNSENGIAVSGGNLAITDSEVTDNTESGFYVLGGSQITIQANTISSNGDGIILVGDLTAEININQNRIHTNTNAGIVLAADAYSSTNILNNTISENAYGFYVASTTSTYITRNYILTNGVGVFYEDGSNHVAYFNDIYGNDVGMDVSSSATVIATRNYWGDGSGPYHESLNPRGKGNIVGGDGSNLDFIFFLTAPIGYNNTSPTAIFWTDKVLVAPNQNVTLIGADSQDEGRVDQYLYDFGDGNTSGWTTLSLFVYNYSTIGTYNAKLRVMDDFGAPSSLASATINVQNLPSLQDSVSLSTHAADCNENVSVTVYVSDGTNPVGNATVALFPIKGGNFEVSSGLTNATGHFTTTYTAPNVTELAEVRIMARASKAGYADGSNYEYLEVFPPLVVQISSDPPTVKSEETANIAVHVTSGGIEPVAGAALTLSTDNGHLTTSSGITDLNGDALFVFTAPQTLVALSATIQATAAKAGYVNGEGQALIPLMPKVLDVQVLARDGVTISEGQVNLTVHVTYEAIPITEANVTVASNSEGSFSITTGLTDLNGDLALNFTAPQVNEQQSITIKAQAAKAKYADGEGALIVTVNPGILEVQIISATPSIKSPETAVITVYVTCNATPIVNSSVRVLAGNGNFSVATGFSDASGNAVFIFNAPATPTQLFASIRANATKNGYISAENETAITITPETVSEAEGGLSLITILLIVIPIVVLVIVVVLIKLKVITVSRGEEE